MHANYTAITPDGAWLYDRFNSVLTPLRMPVLLMVSGFLANGLRSKANRETVDRALSLLWIYVVWTVVTVTVHGIMNGSLSLTEYGSSLAKPQSPLWFIQLLILLTLSITLLRRVPAAVIVGAAGAVSILMNIHILELGDFGRDQMVRFAVFFYVGYFFKRQLLQVSVSHSWPRLAIGASAFGLMHGADMAARALCGEALFLPLEQLLICLVILNFAQQLVRLPLPTRQIERLGRNTLPIFLVHELWISALMQVPIPLNSYLRAPLFTTLALIASLITHRAAMMSGFEVLYRKPKWLSLSEG